MNLQTGRRVTVGTLVCASTLMLVVRPAAADTDFLPGYGKPAAIDVGGQNRLYVITAAGRLAFTATQVQDGWHYASNPPGSATLSTQSGIAVADSPAGGGGSWNGPRLFVIAYSSPYQLLEYNPTLNTWLGLGTPIGADFTNFPATDALYYDAASIIQYHNAMVVLQHASGTNAG